MDRRLPPRTGEWINRCQPIQFRFEGQVYRGFEGDVLASALWANDVRLLGRSFKYHRPRGIYSLAGHDANMLVEDDSGTNMRGDLLPIAEGMDVCAVNTIGGLARDQLQITEWGSPFLPVGFYYKAFHTPRRLFPFYENQMRKVAGLGRIHPDNVPVPTPKDYAFCELLVVGAGPAGMAAALSAAEHGVQVVLVDEQVRLGGSLAWQGTGDAAGHRFDRDLTEQVTQHANIEVRCNTQVAGCYADLWFALVDEHRLTKLRTQAVVIAAGCIEQPAVFQNNDLPGVMLASAAQRLMHLYAVKPFDQAVILAANRDGYQAALDLHAASVEVAAVVDLRPGGESSELGQQVSAAGIKEFRGHAIYEALPAAGKKRIRGAVVCELDQQGQPTSTMQTIACDGIAMSVGWAPNGGLLYQAGGRFAYAEHVEQLIPSTLPAGVFAAGRLNGVFALQGQIADGRYAGQRAAHYLRKFDGAVSDAVRHDGPPPSHPYPIVPHKGKKNFVDFDEDLHLADLVHAHQEGYDNIELLKRFTTVGMGPTQGKLSNTNAVRILAKLNRTSINETGTTTSRPFYQPVPIRHLAGRRFHPQRRTPMHRLHVQAGGVMMHAGAWLRPEYYACSGKGRADCILDEANNVRKNVGLIDVSTLGKLEVSGRDAVAFLERIYTGRFAKQTIGRLRYGLACDESGVIIDDGVIARLANDRFYVTATSSGAAAFYRELQRWALIFDMDVTLTNVTGQLAAMNLAGPRSRDVLQDLTDLDLRPAAFPYLAVREGTVAGIPAKLLRTGFVGELSYEIHVPASCGCHVWSVLTDAGGKFGTQPFGVEAQRLLRLEKGHLLVSQDTDALTTPLEADAAWAIGKNKSFFIGSRSLDIQRKKPLTRLLVGLKFDLGQRQSLPDECHLIIADGEIAGRITSIAKRSTLGYPIAMAFVRPDLAIVGTTLRVRIDDGSFVEAKIARLPFYDPQQTRQQ